MSLIEAVQRPSAAGERSSRAFCDVCALLSGDVTLCERHTLRSEPRDRPRCRTRRCGRGAPRTSTIHEAVKRKLADSSSGSHRSACQNPSRATLDAQLRTQPSARNQCSDGRGSHRMSGRTARGVREGMACCVRQTLSGLPDS